MIDHASLRLPVPSLILLIALCLCPALVLADTDESKVVRFNISPNGYPPYLIVDQGSPSGIMWDVMKAITDRLGYTLQAKRVPRKRVDQMLQDGYIDATSRAREWTDQPDQFQFTTPVVAIEEVFFIPTESSFHFNSIEDLYSRTLVTHLGYLYPSLEPHFEAGRIKRFDVARDQDMFTYALHGERFDAAVADRLVGKWILRNRGLKDRFRISEKGISHYGYRIMLRKDWGAFAQQFNRELTRLRETGELDNILSRYR
jgi:polar amino acid transport system substrate-binding protein